MNYVKNIGIFSVLSNKDIDSFIVNMKNSLDLILIYTPKNFEINYPKHFMDSEKIPLYVEDTKDNRVIFFGSLYFIGYILEKFSE